MRICELSQIAVSENLFMNGRLLNDLKIKEHYNLNVIGILDIELSNELTFIHDGCNPKLDNGDVLVVIGTPDSIIDFKGQAT